MRKSTLLRNIIVIVVLALAVLTGLSTLLLSIIGKGVYAQQKADEIIPRAESIGSLCRRSNETLRRWSCAAICLKRA